MKNRFMHEQLAIDTESPIIARNYNYAYFTYPWHIHDEFEIIFVKESWGERLVADTVETFQPNDVTLVGHRVPHYMRSAPEYENETTHGRVKGTIIQFEENFMSHAIKNYVDFSHIKKLLDDSIRGINFPYPENKDIITSIEQLPDSKGAIRIFNLLHLLDQMACFKNKRYLGSPHFSPSTLEIHDSRMEKILSYLNLHFLEDLTLNDISSIIGMNPSAFSRYFKEKFGKNYTEYLLELRIKEAKKLITHSSMDIVQICFECGFNTVTHFNRVFKRITGLTPTEYRKYFL